MRRLATIIGMLLLAYAQAHAQAPEYRIKAAMLANFALFVDWPPAAFPMAESPFIVCVLGDDPFGPWLRHEMGERVGTHPVEIRQVREAEAARECHMVFLSRSEEPRMEKVMAVLRQGGALIVSDAGPPDDFCSQGGMIALTMEGNRVRFELNADAAEEAGLVIGSRLKRVARSTACGEGR